MSWLMDGFVDLCFDLELSMIIFKDFFSVKNVLVVIKMLIVSVIWVINMSRQFFSKLVGMITWLLFFALMEYSILYSFTFIHELFR